MAYIGNSPGVASQRIVTTFTATAGQTTFTPSSGYTVGYLDVYHNGVKLINGDDYTASNGSTFALASGAASGDVIEAVAYLPRGLSDGYTKAEADTRYVNASGDTMTGQLEIQRNATMSLTNFYNSSDPSLRLKSSGASSVAGLYLDSEGPSGGRASGAVHVEPVAADNWRGKLVHTYTADGSNGAYVVRQFHPSNAASYDRLIVDPSGRVTMPYQPAFFAYNSIANGHIEFTSVDDTAIWESTRFNIGGHYSTSTGRFTAPIDGVYSFTVHLGLWENSSNEQVTPQHDIRINGATIDGCETYCRGLQDSTEVTFSFYLNANDYVTFTSRIVARLHQRYSNFSGYLVG